MLRGPFLLLSILMLSVALLAQEKDCPTISVIGPVGVTEPGGLARFTVEVSDPRMRPLTLEYKWISSTGAIEGGQGTTSIQIRKLKGEGLGATVAVTGLPNGCTNQASEYAPDGSYILPVKIGFSDDPSARYGLDFDAIVEEMKPNPGHQLYIFFAYISKPVDEKARVRQREVLGRLAPAIGGVDRITVVEVSGAKEFVELWRVPPGASNPDCEKCKADAPSCPAITVTGPMSPAISGKEIEFSVALSRALPNTKIVWQVSTGVIVAGQGTNKIRAVHSDSGQNLTATAEVHGLPKECPNTASETAPPFCGSPTLIDEFSTPVTRVEKGRLEAAVVEQRKQPDYQLYIIDYFKAGTSKFAIREKIKRMTEYLVEELKLKEASFEIVAEDSSGEPTTKIYLIAPGMEKPAP